MNSFLRSTLAGAGYCAGLIPRALLALALSVVGRPAKALAVWRRPGPERPGLVSPRPARPRATRTAGHAVLSLALGLVALIPLGMLVLFVLRGVLYGFVDRGPYDDSWGGPSLAGAWIVHLLVALPFAVAALLALAGLARVHRILTAALAEGRSAPGATAVALLLPLPASAFFIAWLHQI